MAAVRNKPRKRYTPAQARNIMRRSIEEIVDPGPTSIVTLWEWFESRCAYCDRPLDPADRNAHTDHAEPGGGNHIGNLILSCGACNGDEKRDLHWHDFLKVKALDEATFTLRERRILDWFAANPRSERFYGPEVEALKERCEGLVEEFRQACNDLQDAVRRPGQPPIARSAVPAAKVFPDGSPEAAVVAAKKSIRSASWTNLNKGVRSLQRIEHEPFGSDNVRNNSRTHVNRIARVTGFSLAELMDIFDRVDDQI